MKEMICILMGGFIGASLRYLSSIVISKWLSFGSISWATLSINYIGSFIFGVFQTMTMSNPLSAFVFIGVLGAFTTFSTFSIETVKLFENGEYKQLILYIILTIMGSPLMFSIGYYLISL